MRTWVQYFGVNCGSCTFQKTKGVRILFSTVQVHEIGSHVVHVGVTSLVGLRYGAIFH